jgi:hypothetical protein
MRYLGLLLLFIQVSPYQTTYSGPPLGQVVCVGTVQIIDGITSIQSGQEYSITIPCSGIQPNDSPILTPMGSIFSVPGFAANTKGIPTMGYTVTPSGVEVDIVNNTLLPITPGKFSAQLRVIR